MDWNVVRLKSESCPICAGIRRRHSPWYAWSVLRLVNLFGMRGAPESDLVSTLEAEPATKQSAVLSEKLAQLYLGESRTDHAAGLLRQALTLQPTPQTTVRLTLELGQVLETTGREAEALKLYDGFQRNAPGWPGAVGLYQRMQGLAEKLGQPAAAARYGAEVEKGKQQGERPKAEK